jgi:hypothetical protein
MTKIEIIERTLRQIRPIPFQTEEQDEEAFIISVLQDRLPDGDIRTCEDFKHLGVECCEICHDSPHYELSVIDLPDGGKAWVCDSVKHAMYPEKYRDRREAEQMLREIFGEDVDD